jgi:hypothetical protein
MPYSAPYVSSAGFATLKQRLLPGLSLLLLVLPQLLVASPYTEYGQSPIDFSLSLYSADLTLQAHKQDYPLTLERISISVFEAASPRLQFGFLTGSSYLSLDNDSVSTGFNPAGYHIGLAMRGRLGSNPQLGFDANYVFQDTRDETDSQSVTLRWREWLVEASARVTLGQQLGIIVGGGYVGLDGQRRARGTINDNLTLELASDSIGRLELEWRVPPGGHISLAFRRGAYDDITFNFARRF